MYHPQSYIWTQDQHFGKPGQIAPGAKRDVRMKEVGLT